MSTTMNSIQRNNETNFDVFDFNKNKKNLNNNGNSIHLRDQLTKLLAECFIQGTKDESNITPNISSLIVNNNIEKIENLENQISLEEKKIAELEKNKNQKLIKIEDLRKIIERIASEDSYDKTNFVIIKNKKFMPRERSWSNTSNNKLERNVSTVTNSTAHVSDNSMKGDSENEEIDGCCDGEGALRGDKHCYVNNSNSSKPDFSSTTDDHLHNCLLYWQDNIYPHNYKA